MSDQILVSRADGVCEVRFNRPEKRNAITFAMYEALYRGLREAQADAAVRVVLLAGEGAGFCAGNDLNDFLTGPPFSAEHPVMGFLHTLATFEKPLLAAIHGQTVGIGVTLLLHCDLVVAARSARLSMPFVALGLVPEAASSLLLPRLVGQQRAAELLLLGKPFDAATCGPRHTRWRGHWHSSPAARCSPPGACCAVTRSRFGRESRRRRVFSPPSCSRRNFVPRCAPSSPGGVRAEMRARCR